jgi:hypothetical protein
MRQARALIGAAGLAAMGYAAVGLLTDDGVRLAAIWLVVAGLALQARRRPR